MTSLDTKFSELAAVVAVAQRNQQKFDKGVKCEATRCRSALSQAAKLVSILRKDILEASKSMPTKTKKPVELVPVDDVPPPPELVRQSHDVVEVLPVVEEVPPVVEEVLPVVAATSPKKKAVPKPRTSKPKLK